jgi:hypothetical protein
VVGRPTVTIMKRRSTDSKVLVTHSSALIPPNERQGEFETVETDRDPLPDDEFEFAKFCLLEDGILAESCCSGDIRLNIGTEDS